MANIKYTVDAKNLQHLLVGIFGTRKHAYDTLRLEEVGLPMSAFYRIWRDGKSSLAEHQTLMDMLDVWWSFRPATLREFAEYSAPFTDRIPKWAANLQAERNQP